MNPKAKTVLLCVIFSISIPIYAIIHLLVSEMMYGIGGTVVLLPLVFCLIMPGVILTVTLLTKNIHIVAKVLMATLLPIFSFMLNVVVMFMASWLTG